LLRQLRLFAKTAFPIVANATHSVIANTVGVKQQSTTTSVIASRVKRRGNPAAMVIKIRMVTRLHRVATACGLAMTGLKVAQLGLMR